MIIMKNRTQIVMIFMIFADKKHNF